MRFYLGDIEGHLLEISLARVRVNRSSAAPVQPHVCQPLLQRSVFPEDGGCDSGTVFHAHRAEAWRTERARSHGDRCASESYYVRCRRPCRSYRPMPRRWRMAAATTAVPYLPSDIRFISPASSDASRDNTRL